MAPLVCLLYYKHKSWAMEKIIDLVSEHPNCQQIAATLRNKTKIVEVLTPDVS